MTDAARSDVTRLLGRLREGKGEAEAALFEEVYPELRRRARGQRRRWKGDPSLQTTALAHEAYLDLVGPKERSWKNRSHFFAVAATAMRHILIKAARQKRTQKRGGEAPTLSLEALRDDRGRAVATEEERAEVLVALDEALGELEAERSRAARVVECRFFGGMTIEETAEALGVSDSTVSRDWKVAQTRLYQKMKRILEGEAPDERES
jgi:RNA polymerase sigma factor (TIGR02999 family)